MTEITAKQAIELQRIAELRAQGLSWRGIGAQLGKSGPAIFKYLKLYQPELLGAEFKVKPHRQAHTAGTRAKMAAAHIGKKSGFVGRQHSAESRNAMSKPRKMRPASHRDSV